MNTFLSALVGMGFIAVIFSIVILVLLIVAGWKIFEKAGEPGWKSIIPIYNAYTYFKITWETKWFWISLLLAFVGSLLSRMSSGVVATAGSVALIAVAVISFTEVYKLAKSFGHGIGFMFGLLFLPNIFTLILGFGGSKYLGPQK